MEVRVNMLNVLDGDAILVELEKLDEKMVMVIDCGKAKYYHEKVKDRLEEVLRRNEKSSPDIVVCTHYDSDILVGSSRYLRTTLMVSKKYGCIKPRR